MTPACPYCGTQAALVTGREVYPRRPDLYAKPVWRCAPCDAHVGCHPGTQVPLGRLADPALRAAKMAAHCAFDPIWRDGRMTRREAYRWPAARLGLTTRKCHIGYFDLHQCKAVVDAVVAEYERGESAWT